MYDEEREQFAYRIMLRGPRDSALNVGGGINRSGGEGDHFFYKLTRRL